MPELRQLRVFVAVAQELNFTRAGERLHLGQQAVSKSVRQLERELGVALLERTTREVRLTPAGAALLEAAPEVLAAADAAFARAAEVGRGLSGTVRVGVSPAISLHERAEVIAVLRDEAPDLSVSVRDVRPGQVRRLLRAGELDMIVARTAPPGPGIEQAQLRPTPTVLAVPERHRLAGAPSARLFDLDGERLLTWSPPGTEFTDLLVAALAAAGATVAPVEAHVTGSNSLIELSEAGAVAIVPAGTTESDGVVQLTLEDGLRLPLIAMWAAGPTPPAARRIRARLGAPPEAER